MKNSKLKSAWQTLLEESSLLRQYFWKYRYWILVGVFSLFVVDLLEIVPPLLLKESFDALTTNNPGPTLSKMALLYLAVSCVQAVGRYMWRMFLVRASMQSGRDIRQTYAEKLFSLSSSFYDRKRVGDLMALATSDVEAARMALGAGMIVFADAVFYLVTIPIAMFVLSPELTVLAFVPLVFVPFIVIRNEREIHKRFQKVQASFSHLASLAQEGLVGARVVKSFAIEDTLINRFTKAGIENVTLNVHLARVQTAFGPLLDFSVSLGLVLLLYVGGEKVIGLTLSLGTFVAFQRYIQKLVWPMAALGLAITHYQKAVASSRRLKEVFSEKEEIPHTPKRNQNLRGHLMFNDLTFSYPGSSKPAVRNINLVIEPGQRVAFVGSIGSGKTTLLSLISRLYALPRGMLYLDKQDINDWSPADLREQVGFVAQDVFLFSETIVENVSFGLTCTMLDIEGAAQQAAIHEEVQMFPLGYQTKLGERGTNVSGGQKQRLSIARALVRKPPLLILDDALSSVDFQTEERILSSLRKAGPQQTQILAAHRISTVQHSDLILVLSGGEIVQQGTHRQLITQNGLYRQFHEQQKVQEELDAYLRQIEV